MIVTENLPREDLLTEPDSSRPNGASSTIRVVRTVESRFDMASHPVHLPSRGELSGRPVT